MHDYTDHYNDARRGIISYEFMQIVLMVTLICAIIYGFYSLIIFAIDIQKSPATKDCDVISLHLVPMTIKKLPDGDSFYINKKSVLLDDENHLLVDYRDLSSIEPTNFRIFRYGDKYDIYIQHDELRKANFERKQQKWMLPITKIIPVENIESVDIDIAKRTNKLSELVTQ